MSKKSRKFNQGGNEVVDAGSMQDQLAKVLVSELNVEEAIAAISPTFIMPEFDRLCAMEEDLLALKEHARMIVDHFHTQRRLFIVNYDQAIGARTRVAQKRNEVVETHYNTAVLTPAFMNVTALYLELKKEDRKSVV